MKGEGSNSFSEFHLYVCCAFLKQWKNKLMEMDFQVRLRLPVPCVRLLFLAQVSEN